MYVQLKLTVLSGFVISFSYSKFYLHDHMWDSEMVKHVARMEEKRNARIGFVLQLKGTGNLEHLVIDGSII
jgi:hypothetical protein